MKEFNELKELLAELEKDKSSPSVSAKRYPVRFIFMNSQNSLIEFSKAMLEQKIKRIDLIDSLPYEDGWLTPSNIQKVFKSANESCFILPLSEVLRFFSKDDFSNTLRAISEIESSTNIRIYMPMIGLKERFEIEFWNSFYRKDEWAPVWMLNEASDKITVYQINFDLEDFANVPSGFNKVNNTLEWLKLAEKNDLRNVLSTSKSLALFYNNFLPDSRFDLKVVNNYKEYLDYLQNTKLEVDYSDTESKYWKEIIKEVSNFKINSFEDLFLNHFNYKATDKIDVQTLISTYIKSAPEFDKWLIKKYILKSKISQTKYLQAVLENTESLDKLNFIKSLWLKAFDEEDDDYYEERKLYLYYIHKSLKEPFLPVEQELSEKLKEYDNIPLKEKSKLLTSITFAERKHIIESLKKSESFEDDKEILKDIYPELYHYLNWNNIEVENEIEGWIFEYFKEYNESKVLDEKSDRIEELLNTYNKDINALFKWYYKIKKELPHDFDKVVWVDGLGAEWFPLLSYYLERYGKENNKFIQVKKFTRANLPSITECNRYSADKIDDLDKYIHSESPYKHPDDMIMEFEIIKNIASRIISKSDNSVYIVSDHGFTFLSQKRYGQIKRLDFEGAEHDGRCIQNVKKDFNDEYYVTLSADSGDCANQKSIVALKHHSLDDVPAREVHGGATPEEVIVPFILVTKNNESEEYVISPKHSVVESRNPVLTITIKPKPKYKPSINLDNKHFELNNTEENNYKTNLNKIKPGTYELEVEIGTKKYKITIEVKGGFKEKELL